MISPSGAYCETSPSIESSLHLQAPLIEGIVHVRELPLVCEPHEDADNCAADVRSNLGAAEAVEMNIDFRKQNGSFHKKWPYCHVHLR